MKLFKTMFLLSLVASLCACASMSRTPDYRYEKDAVRLHLKADSRLNLYEGTPHTLLLCIYNLKDPNAFNQVADERDGFSKLLECARFDPSVSSAKKVVVQPGDEITESLDRAEGAKYVSVVAGYYDVQKDKAIRFYPIPLSTFTKSPETLKVDLYLGSREIQEMKGK